MMQNSRLEVATTLVCYHVGCIHISEFVFFVLFFAFSKIKLLFVAPSFRKQLLFSKIKLLFVTFSFENNCFFSQNLIA